MQMYDFNPIQRSIASAMAKSARLTQIYLPDQASPPTKPIGSGNAAMRRND